MNCCRARELDESPQSVSANPNTLNVPVPPARRANKRGPWQKLRRMSQSFPLKTLTEDEVVEAEEDDLPYLPVEYPEGFRRDRRASQLDDVLSLMAGHDKDNEQETQMDYIGTMPTRRKKSTAKGVTFPDESVSFFVFCLFLFIIIKVFI